MDRTNFTPKSLYDRLRKTIIGQDRYLQALSTAAWIHSMKHRHFLDTSEIIEKPKQNLLVIGESGTGKTLAVQTLGKLLNLPVIIEDASSLTGEGWRGRSVSEIGLRIRNAADREEDRIYSIICLDEIDKVFRAGRANHNGTADAGLLPLNNLLAFLAGGTITCREKDSSFTFDSSNFLIICLGAFEELPKIIKKRLTGARQIGFCGSGHEEPETGDILQHVTDDDLREFGIPLEFLGRLNLITATRPLNAADYRRILTQSDVSPLSQYNGFLSQTSGIRISITDNAVWHISEKAGQSKEGARMLARLVTDILQPAIFSIGENPDISGIEIDCAEGGLFTRSVYDYTHRQVPDEPPRCLSAVPLICTGNRGDILLACETIKKSSVYSRTLPETYVCAATCVIAAAICSQLLYAGGEEQSMLTLYRQIGSLPSERIPHPSGRLEDMINEFVQKAKKDMDFEKAKATARRFVVDYCRNCLAYESPFSA